MLTHLAIMYICSRLWVYVALTLFRELLSVGPCIKHTFLTLTEELFLFSYETVNK